VTNQVSLKVLVVDDEPELSELVCTWLSAAGHRPEYATTPGEALQLLAADAFDMIVTDVVMPGGIDGIDLATRAAQQQAGIKVLLCSGYSARLSELGSAPWPLLSKPYRRAAFMEAIARASQTVSGDRLYIEVPPDLSSDPDCRPVR